MPTDPKQRVAPAPATITDAWKAIPAIASLDLLQAMGDPVLLVDEQRAIHYANRGAQSLMSRNPVLRDRKGRLSCPNLQADGQLSLAMSGLRPPDPGDAAPQGGQFLRLSDGADRHLALYLFALRWQGAPARPTPGPTTLTLMVLHDPIQRIELDADLVAATWDLTAAEARAAVALARGQTPKALARESGLSLNTIRSQLQATMAKTGTRRQAQLVSLLLSMPVMPGTGCGDGAPQQRGVPPPRAG